MEKWQYVRMSDDVFLLVLRANTKVSKLDKHPAVKEMVRVMSEARQVINQRYHRKPSGHVRFPRAWSGKYNLGGIEFTIPALYAFPKFFGLVCDTTTGNHDSDLAQQLVNAINSGITE